MFEPIKSYDVDGNVLLGLSSDDKLQILVDTKDYYATNPFGYDSGRCVYHASNGAHCAIGRLDTKGYLVGIEGAVTGADVQIYIAAVLFGEEYIGHKLSPGTNNFLRALQKAHDDATEDLSGTGKEKFNANLDFMYELCNPYLGCL